MMLKLRYNMAGAYILLTLMISTLTSGTPLHLARSGELLGASAPPADEQLADPLAPPTGEKLHQSANILSTFDWPDTAKNFPNPFSEPLLCNIDNLGNPNWVCDADGRLTSSNVLNLSRKIEGILNTLKCICSSCVTTHPKGRFSIGVAIAGNVTGSLKQDYEECAMYAPTFQQLSGAPKVPTGDPKPFGTDLKKVQTFSYNLRKTQWVNMKRCDDMLVIGLSIDTKTVYLSPDPKVSVLLDSYCISDILDKTKTLFESGDWYKALDATLDYVKNALNGGRCGTKTGLSVGQIVGIVCGVVAGVASLVGLVLCCVGFFQNWECVAGTCIGVCIGCLLAYIQACINAIIFSLIQSVLAECGCEDCCDCDPLSCVPEDSPDAGGGMEF